MQIEFKAVKTNMNIMFEYSYKEYEQYLKSNEIIYLQQAGEKLFNCIENYIQFVAKIQVFSFYEITRLTNDKKIKKLLFDGRDLHRYFYRGELEMDPSSAEELYLSVYKRVKKLLLTIN